MFYKQYHRIFDYYISKILKFNNDDVRDDL